MKKTNEKIEMIFLVRQKELKYSTKQKLFLKLELINKDGNRVFGVFWKNPEKVYQEISFGQAVRVKSHIIKATQNKLLEIDQLSLVEDLNLQDFISKKSINLESLEWLETLLSNKKNSYQEILNSLFTPLVYYQILTLPAGKLWLFNYPGGLFKRTKTLIDWIEKIHLEEMDLELMKTAVLLQSFAFINGFKRDSVIEYTSEARLISLPILALVSVYNVINSSRLDLIKKDHLKHLILIQPQVSSGNLFIEPQSAEAFLLYDLQILMLNLHGVENLISKDENKNRNWTSYNNLLKRFILNDRTKLK